MVYAHAFSVCEESLSFYFSMLCAGAMLTKAKPLFLLSLLLLFCLWKETQGRCSSCPSNGCSQTGMSQGWALFKMHVYRLLTNSAAFRHAPSKHYVHNACCFCNCISSLDLFLNVQEVLQCQILQDILSDIILRNNVLWRNQSGILYL